MGSPRIVQPKHCSFDWERSRMCLQVLFADGWDRCLCSCHVYVCIPFVHIDVPSYPIPVIHPGICMHWIKEHWEAVHYQKAENIILGLVSWHCFPTLDLSWWILPSDGKIQDKAQSRWHSGIFIQLARCTKDRSRIHQSWPSFSSQYRWHQFELG